MISVSNPAASVPDPAANAARAKALAAHIEQLKCRQMADAQGVLPRDRTDFILRMYGRIAAVGEVVGRGFH